MTEELKISIEKLYKTFSIYPGNPGMQGSPLFSEPDNWNRRLFSKQLQHLPAEDVSTFCARAITTWGEVSDFKHFLPRILELTTVYDDSLYMGSTFDKLEYANWDIWPDDEKKAILKFMIALWDDVLKNSSKDAERIFTEYFSCLASYYPDFEELLKIWEMDLGLNSTKHLANFIFNERVAIFDKGTFGALQKSSEKIIKLRHWLLSDRTVKRLEAAFYEYAEEPFSETISWAEKILRDEQGNKH